MKTSFNHRSLTSSFALVAAVSALTVSVARGEVVYDNTSTLDPNAFHNGTLNVNGSIQGPYEFGDDLTLAGTSRLVNHFVFNYFGDIVNNPTATATIRFYANDQPILDPVTGKTIQGPGSLLWQSDPFQIVNGRVEASMSVPLVKVPDVFTFTMDAPGLTGGVGSRVGLYVSTQKATIGSSFNDFWEKTPGGWVVSNVKPARADFSVKVEAVPEPGTIALGIAGVALLGLAVRRGARR